MLQFHTPKLVRSPFANYSHAVEFSANSRVIMCSGQLAITVDDVIPETALDQTTLCFENISKILKSAEMSIANIVRINAYVIDRKYMQPYMQVRDNLFKTPAPASTLMIVSGFTRPEFKVEIEVTAAD